MAPLRGSHRKRVCRDSGGALNEYDPIMLEPVDKKNTWKFIRPNGNIQYQHLNYFDSSCSHLLNFIGTAVVFNIGSLVNYLITTGDFADPETRLCFSDNDLKNIDMIVSILLCLFA